MNAPVSTGAAEVDTLEVSVFTVPTDLPEAGATLAWDSTTMVLVEARVGEVVGTGWTYGPPACAHVVADQLAPVAPGCQSDGCGCGVRGDGRLTPSGAHR